VRSPRPLPCALSFDDAPAIEPLDLSAEGDATMDSLRETLERHGVTHCVAFVIGERARDHTQALRRWLASGFELGNHTHSHCHASKASRDAFLDSVDRCDGLLADVGAFDDGRPRYFRYPFGDRGESASERLRIRTACVERGYTIADVSVNLHDYCYEAPLTSALQARAEGRADKSRLIERRYEHYASACIAHAASLEMPRGFVHIAAAHCGRVSARTLDSWLGAMRGHVQWEPMSSAVRCAEYVSFGETAAHNGIIGDALRSQSATLVHSAARRIARRAARLTRRLNLLQQDRLGPLWPHLTE
jgi:hypothetical protein